MTVRRAPLDNLFRFTAGGARLVRADDDQADDLDDTTLRGHFAVFNVWTRIASIYEGTFLERLEPGAFKRTIGRNRDRIVVQYDHGYDPFIGDSPLGPIDDLSEDGTVGVAYSVPLLDTDYNRDRVLPMLQGRLMNGDRRGSVLGASFRFRVIRDEWNRSPDPSDDNPDGLDERTIREVELLEFGPVVFPAYPDATAEAGRSVSVTDHYLRRQLGVLPDPTSDTAPGDDAPADVAPDGPAASPPSDQRRRYSASDARNLIALTKEHMIR